MKSENIKQAVKFATVGVVNTLVDYVIFYVALSVLNVDKSLSQVIATACAMCVSYIANKNWTFEKKGKTTKTQIAKFIITNLVSMCFTILFMNFFHDILAIHEWANSILKFINIPYRLEGDIGVMFCKIAGSLLSLVINFLGNKFWVFKDRTSKENNA